MQTELLALFGVCLAGAMGEMLLPTGTGIGTRRLLRFLLSLSVLLLILTPFLHFLKSNADFLQGELPGQETELAEYEQIFNKALSEQSAADLQNGLHALLRSEYGIQEENCTVLVFFAQDGALQRVSIFLSGNALIKDPQVIEKDLEARLNCLVEVR